MKQWHSFKRWLDSLRHERNARAATSSSPKLPQRARLVEVRSHDRVSARHPRSSSQHSTSRQVRTHAPLVTMGSKLGFTSNSGANGVNYAQHLNRYGTRFSVVKATGDLSWLADIKALDQKTTTIAQINTGPIGQINPSTDSSYDDVVRVLFAPIERHLKADPNSRYAIDYWELELAPNKASADRWRTIAECLIACIARANQLRIKLALFGLPSGGPEWWELEAIVATGVFAHAKAAGHILTCHEKPVSDQDPIAQWYGHPIPAHQSQKRWVQVREDGLFFFDFDPAKSERPRFWDAGIAGPLMFRYRFLYELLRQRDEVVPLVVTQANYGGGYTDAFDTAQRAEWYDVRAANDFYLLGHLPHVHQASRSSTLSDYSYAYPSFIQYVVRVRDRVNAHQPDSTDIEEPDVMKSAVVRRKVPKRPAATSDKPIFINLLPKVATLDEKIQVLTATHARKVGILQSATDARALVVQGAENSRVTVWEPSRWSGDIGAYLTEGYVASSYRGLPEPDGSLEATTPHEPPHAIVINLLPEDATLMEKRDVAQRTHAQREAIVQSAEIAIALYRIGTSGSHVKVWEPERWSGDMLEFLRSRGVWIEVARFSDRARSHDSIRAR